MPNVSLQPASTEVSLDELFGGIKRGLFIEGRGGSSIDQQRYNFQFGGGIIREITNGKLGAMVKDAAYQSRTPDFWASCDGLGGAVDVSPVGDVGRRQGRARPDQRRQPRLSAGALPANHCPQHGGRLMLTRDEALKICETVLAHAKAAGAEDANVSLQSSVESHARFADNRINTSGRSEDLDITVTVWVGRRRGSITGNDSDAAALKRLADEAVQIARVSPVHREYVPTLGPLDYPDSRGFAAATANVNVTARAAALEKVLAACRDAKVTGAGFHTARASAGAAATANGNRRYFQSSEAGMSVTARSADGTGSGYYAGDHFDLARLDAPRIAERAVAKAVQSRAPEADRAGDLPGDPRAAGRCRSARIPHRQLRRPNRRRRPQRLRRQGRQDPGRREAVQRAAQRSTAIRCMRRCRPCRARPRASPPRGCRSSRRACSRTSRYSRYWAQERKREPTAGPVNYIIEGSQPALSTDEMIKGMDRGLLISRFWYVRLVDPRTIALTGLTRDGLWWIEKGRISHPVRNLRFNQSVLAMLAPWNVEAIGAPQRLSPLMVPALKLAAFTFTSASDAI